MNLTFLQFFLFFVGDEFMRLVYAADLHSEIQHYDELFELLKRTQADVLVLGGDLFAYTKDFKLQLNFFQEYLKPYFLKLSIPVFIISGNTDWPVSVQLLRSHQTELGLHFLSNHPVEFFGFTFYGLSSIPVSPFVRKDDERRDLIKDTFNLEGTHFVSDSKGQLWEKSNSDLNYYSSIEEELNQISENKDAIWVMHSPPYGGVLDLLSNGTAVGSKAISQRIIQIQPLLSLHGHIHESPYTSGSWFHKIGSTLAINPGQGESLHAIYIEFKKGEIILVEHTVFGSSNEI